MNEAALTLAAIWVLVAFLLIIQPWLTRRNVLFGVVFGNDDIWRDKGARQIRLRYLRAMIIGTILLSLLIVLYFLVARPSQGAAMVAYSIGMVALLILGSAVFIIFHARTRAFKAKNGLNTGLESEKITVETSLPDRQTVMHAGWLLLLAPVLLATYGVALFGYPAMPATLPVHYSYKAVDGWAPKSRLIVMLPLLTGTVIDVFLFV